MTTDADVHPEPTHVLPHPPAPELPETGFSKWVDCALNGLANGLSWLWVVLIAVILVNVVMKNAFGQGRVEFEEIQWHIYSLVFMLGLASALVADGHVRIDVLSERFSLKTKAWIDLLGLLFLFLPFIGLVAWFTIPFVADSFATMERSTSPAGLPYRWAIKSVLLVAMMLLLVGAASRLSRIVAFLFMGRPAVTPGH
jgi:TRAP-type mannitol/chloroaromatic compound transport system permease small subunit